MMTRGKSYSPGKEFKRDIFKIVNQYIFPPVIPWSYVSCDSAINCLNGIYYFVGNHIIKWGITGVTIQCWDSNKT